MDRFFEHFSKWVHLSVAARAFIRRHGRVMSYLPEAYFMQPDERMPYWCLVLEGLACGYTLDEDGRRRIHWFALPMQGFAGVRHLYTPKKAGHYIQFLEVSTILRLPALRMREGKERFAELSELLHVMKQRYIDQREKLVKVLQKPTASGRYATFMDEFLDVAARTKPEQQMDFINVGRTQFFEARKHRLHTK